MRRPSIFVVFVFSLGFFLIASSSLYAGGLESAKAGASSVRSGARKVVDAALQPGTYQFAEKLVKLVGQSVDWYFDRLVIAADKSQIGEISNNIVGGIGAGFNEIQLTQSVNQGLDLAEGLAKKFWIQDFTRHILQETQVKIKPYFKGQFEYDSNVFLEPEAPKTRDEVVWTWTPGVTANFPFGDQNQYRIGAVYEARITDFTKYSEHDDIGQSFGGIGNFKLTDALYVNVTEEFVKDAARAGTRSAKRVEYMDQKVSPAAGYNWRDWTFEAAYDNAHRRFDSSIYRQFEYDNNVVTGRIYRTLAPNFRGLVEYNFSHYDYDNDVTRVGRYHQWRTGFVGQLSERTNILARVGYMDRNYNKSNFSTEFDKPVGDIRLQHHLTSRTDLDLSFHRTAYESSFTSNRFFDDKMVQASGTYLFASKLRGRAGGSFDHRHFPASAATGRVIVKRRDLVAAAFAGLDYAFRPWLVMNLDYRYERSNSNNSNFDYTNNQLTTGMTMPL